MPKVVDYPHASFSTARDIANAVDYLGGSCTTASCAERLGKKISGGFKASITAAVKYGLITSKKEILSNTELYKIFKLAYNEEEKLTTLRKAFLKPTLFHQLFERFKGKEIPVSMLDKLLIREFGVDEYYASRVSGYFVDGVKTLNLIEDGRLLTDSGVVSDDSKDDNLVENPSEVQEDTNSKELGIPVSSIQLPIASNNNIFTVMIVGPGMNTKIEINEEDDLIILDAMIKKIKKKLNEGSE